MKAEARHDLLQDVGPVRQAREPALPVRLPEDDGAAARGQVLLPRVAGGQDLPPERRAGEIPRPRADEDPVSSAPRELRVRRERPAHRGWHRHHRLLSSRAILRPREGHTLVHLQTGERSRRPGELPPHRSCPVYGDPLAVRRYESQSELCRLVAPVLCQGPVQGPASAARPRLLRRHRRGQEASPGCPGIFSTWKGARTSRGCT